MTTPIDIALAGGSPSRWSRKLHPDAASATPGSADAIRRTIADRFATAAPGVLLALALLLPGFAAAERPAAKDFTLIVQPGDTLIGLGKRWLKDPRRWRELLHHNQIKNPNRLAVGSTIAIPLSLLRGEAVGVTVTAVNGHAQRAGGAPLAPGDHLREGATIRTGKDGYVTIRLVDGSTLQLQSRGELILSRARRLPGSGATDTIFQMPTGRAEVRCTPTAARSSRFEIRTGLASAAVRGAQFWMASNQRAARVEVTKGTVAFAGLPSNTTSATAEELVSVPAGFGSIVDETRKPIAPVRLLTAPALSPAPVIQYAPSLRYSFAPVSGAVGYRARFASDPRFEQVIRDAIFQRPLISFSGLTAGSYVLRVQAIDKYGLEGEEATELVGMLKRRPRAPAKPGSASDGSAPSWRAQGPPRTPW